MRILSTIAIAWFACVIFAVGCGTDEPGDGGDNQNQSADTGDAGHGDADTGPSDIGDTNTGDTDADDTNTGDTDADDPDAGDTDADDCQPSSDEQLCDDHDKECGVFEAVDECGDQRDIDCGGCPDGDDCQHNICGCFPKTCKQLGDTCGLQSDGCGGQILCNTDCANPIGLGSYHTCIMSEQAGAKCWGRNDRGQLGTKTDDDGNDIDASSEGVFVDGLNAKVLQIFAGEQHTCARDVEGNAYCWGDNDHHQLTQLVDDDESYEAVEMTNLSGPLATIGMGAFHSCGEIAPGEIECWGDNTWAQFGVGDEADYDTPQTTHFEGDTDSSILRFDGGPINSCYLDGIGDLYCWGYNVHGQVGTGDIADDFGDDVYEPLNIAIDVETPIQDVSVGGVFGQGSGAEAEGHPNTISGFVCAIDANGDLQCWGYGEFGQLSVDTGDKNHSVDPITVSDLPGPVNRVAAGGEHVCAIVDGDVYCWGYNEFGQLGDGSNDDSTDPVQVTGLDDDAIDIFAGTFHTCVLLEEGDFKCWGLNSDGQLGDGTNIDRNQPVSVFE